MIINRKNTVGAIRPHKNEKGAGEFLVVSEGDTEGQQVWVAWSIGIIEKIDI
jgi:hypothetical protein